MGWVAGKGRWRCQEEEVSWDGAPEMQLAGRILVPRWIHLRQSRLDEGFVNESRPPLATF